MEVTKMMRPVRKNAMAMLWIAAAMLAITAAGQGTKSAAVGQQIPPPECLTLRGAWQGGYTPCTAETHAQWLNDVTHWRMERRIRIGYNDAQYLIPELKRAESAFIQPQMMVHDRYFY